MADFGGHIYLLGEQSTMLIERVLVLLGAVAAVRAAYTIAMWIWLFALRPATDVRARYGGDNRAWAIVTGGTAGIGLAFVRRLLADGFRVVVASLPGTEGALAAERAAGRVVFVPVDCADVGPAVATVAAAAHAHIGDLGGVRLLVHNVGWSAEMKPFLRHTGDDVDRVLAINLRFPARLTLALLPAMLHSSSPKRRCGVLFVSSQAGTMPASPFASAYGAAKAGLCHFARTLACEHADDIRSGRLDLTCFAPGYVAAGRSPHIATKTRVTGMVSPARLARDALAKLGCGRTVLSPVWQHALMFGALEWLPEGVVGRLVLNELAPAVDQQHHRRRAHGD